MINVPQWVILSAVRYALGRHSYVVSDTVTLVRSLWHELDDLTKRIVVKDINEELTREGKYSNIDSDLWRKLIKDVTNGN